MNDNERLREVETARSGNPVAIARVLVATPSVNPALEEGGAGEEHVAKVAADLLERWGLAVEVREVAPGRPNVQARLDGDGPTLLLNGHLDTVGARGMSVEPFAAEIVGSRLIGRGACDMKGGVAALLAATRRLSTAGPRPNLIVLLTADEEHASLGMAEFVREPPRIDMAVVCEPTGLKVMPAHKGFVWIRASFLGRSAHGSRPDLGVDAIRHAALYLSTLDRYRSELEAREPHQLLGTRSFHAGSISGGTAPSVYADHCEVQLECRTLPGDSGAEVLADLQRMLDELADAEPSLKGSLEIAMERPGTEVPSDSALVRGLLAASEANGVRPDVEGMTAWVDAAFLNEAGVPAVCYGPGDTEQAHTDDEWIEVSEIVTCADVLETFARSLVL